MKIRLIISILVLVFFASCRSSKSNIEVKDDSLLSPSRTLLFQKLDSIYNYRFNSIASYTLPKARIEVNFGSSDYKLNGRVNIDTNKQMKASISIPFPPMTVGSFTMDKSDVSIKSSLANIDIFKPVPSYFLPVVNSLLYGSMPMDILDKLKLNSIYIKDSRYHLAYSGPYNTSIIFQIDAQFRICQLSVSSPDFSVDMFTSDFTKVDSHILPSSVRIVVSSQQFNGAAFINTNTIKINQ